MATLAIHKNQLRTFIRSMYDEGLVNDQFYQLQAMKETTRPDFVVREVASYCLNTLNTFSSLTYLIEQPEVDFLQVNVLARDLYMKTSSIGAEHVKHACAEILRASEANNKEHCFQALYWTKNEYSQLRRKLETVVKMERKIIDLESGP